MRASQPADLQEELLQGYNDGVIKLNHVIHHGHIGHHGQNWHASRAASQIGQIAAVDCASRIAMVCGGTMAEGWASYSTHLMREVGALTPREELWELKDQLRMYARAVVDIRLHQGRYTLEEAIEHYEREANMTPGSARGEAIRNSMFPGAPVMYMLGKEEILRLRREMQQRQGDRFSLRRFHNDLLSYGSIPVSLIGASMRGGATRDEQQPRTGLPVCKSLSGLISSMGASKSGTLTGSMGVITNQCEFKRAFRGGRAQSRNLSIRVRKFVVLERRC